MYSLAVPDNHRKCFGQFFTHEKVAQFMVDWVLQSGENHLYDPAFGLGAFRPSKPEVKFSASEIDTNIIDFYRKAFCEDISFITVEDYFSTWGKKHTNIVCNPPYMRFQKFLNRDKVFFDFKKNLNLNLSGYTNTASAFLLKSLSELNGRGRLSYIMPLEFLNAGYGTLVKQKLLESKHLVGIISLECEKDIFPDATTSVGILLYDSMHQSSEVKFYSFKSIDELDNFELKKPVSLVKVNELDPSAKWLPHFNQHKVEFFHENTVSLECYGRFSRGIATGANEFFVLSKSKALKLELLPHEYVPCITRSSQITKPIFSEQDLVESINVDKPVFLFSADGSYSNAAKKYIRLGESNGYHKRFLTKTRTPWFKTEKRLSSPLLLGVFSRGGYKIIRNTSKAFNLTCYHGFQPNIFGSKYIDHLFLYFFSKAGREIISLSMRTYGDSLDKFEPNDLNTAAFPSPAFFNSISNREVEFGMQSVLDSGVLPDDLEMKFGLLLKNSIA